VLAASGSSSARQPSCESSIRKSSNNPAKIPFGLHWRPLYELKLAVMQGLEGLADYATAMLSFILYLSAILLWLATILVGAALAWKTLGLGWLVSRPPFYIRDSRIANRPTRSRYFYACADNFSKFSESDA
jgi:hypothetical protein